MTPLATQTLLLRVDMLPWAPSGLWVERKGQAGPTLTYYKYRANFVAAHGLLFSLPHSTSLLPVKLLLPLTNLGSHLSRNCTFQDYPGSSPP